MQGRTGVAGMAQRFAAAALEDGGWIPALRSLAEATGSSRAQIVGIGGPSTIPFNWVNDLSDEVLDAFVRINGGSPRINPRVAAAEQARPLEIVHEHHYDRAALRLEDDVYLDFARDNGIPHGCQTVLHADARGLIGLALLRSEADGRTTEAERTTFAAVAPHVAGAVRIRAALEHQGARLVAGAFEAVEAAAFVCDGYRRVAAMTPAAERLLSRGRLRLRDGRLTTHDRDGARTLERAIQERLDPRPEQEPVTGVLLRGGPEDEPLMADVTGLPPQPWSVGFRPRILIVVRGAGRTRSDRMEAVRRGYGLSPAEADIVLRLTRGEEREAIALARGVSVQTVRTQLKAVFAKLGVRREVELMIRLAPLLHGGA